MRGKPLMKFFAATLSLLAGLFVSSGQVAEAKGVIMPPDSVRKDILRISRDSTKLKEALAAYRENGDSVAVGMTLAGIGKFHNLRSEYVRAIHWYQQSASVLKRAGNNREYVNTLVSLATNCRRMGAYSTASDYLFEALMISEEDPDKDSHEGMRQRSYILNGLGNLYKYLNDGTEAENYFRRSLALDEVIGNELGQAMNWNTIGSIYEYRNQFDSAYVMYNRALEHDRKSGSLSGVGICYNQLGQLAMIQGKIDEAEEWHLKAYDVLTKAEDKWNLAKATSDLGWVYIQKGNYPLAKKFLLESEALVAGNRSYGHLQDIHGSLSELYKRQGHFRKALAESELCRMYQDSSAAQRSGHEVTQSRIRYEQERNQIALDKAVHEKEMEANSKRIVLFTSLLVVLLLLVATFLMMRYAVLQRKRNKELADIAAIKNKFISIISHDLKNPVSSQSKLLDMLVDNFDTLPRETIFEQCKELSKSSSSLLDLLMGLLNWSRLGAGKIKYEPLNIPLRCVVEEAVSPMQEQMNLKKVLLDNRIDPALQAFADRNILSTVVRNLVCNAIKFSFKGGHIELDATDEGKDRIRVSVTDHGTGIDAARLSELMMTTRQISSRGTAGEPGSGLGLLVSREMLALAGSSLSASSQEGKGSCFSFTVNKEGRSNG